MMVARLALILHKLPSEIRTMSFEELDAIGYLMKSEKLRDDREAKIREAKAKFK